MELEIKYNIFEPFSVEIKEPGDEAPMIVASFSPDPNDLIRVPYSLIKEE